MDSIVLMRVSQQLEKIDGVVQAAAIMGTENNKLLLREAGLLTDKGNAAGANDIILAVSPSSPTLDSIVLEQARNLLSAQRSAKDGFIEYRPKTLGGALDVMPDANLAVISIPGEYASYEASKALDLGLNVLLFSDNVSLDDEIQLKTRAYRKGLFMLGPDCGTAIINTIPLGFANVVPVGRIGLVSASGTGLQHITCLLDIADEGVSHAIGVGGRDLDDRVGGVMMLMGLQALDNDPDTEVIALVSKPAGPLTCRKVIDVASKASKPCVVCFLGEDLIRESYPNVYFENTLEGAASRVLGILSGEVKIRLSLPPLPMGWVGKSLGSLSQDSRRIVGLFSGGTLCYEAGLVLREMLSDPIYSNLSMRGIIPFDSESETSAHTLLDLGDDQFTRGQPHPMIDLRDRCRRLVRSVEDPSVGIILIDVVLGLNSHPDPASELIPALNEAARRASDMGRTITSIVSLCGSSNDPQSLDVQKEAFLKAGALVTQSNAQAARVAGGVSMDDLNLLMKENFEC
ncbi:acyl-CoA synthetase FdrA [SAR202 cluster bacterium AD-804-J14_MRT_500m]|nr:acyl-CoA synthetase FdrA [SAR202 cluster bacterium AD-804-J14_MRT_500m]